MSRQRSCKRIGGKKLYQSFQYSAAGGLNFTRYFFQFRRTGSQQHGNQRIKIVFRFCFSESPGAGGILEQSGLYMVPVLLHMLEKMRLVRKWSDEKTIPVSELLVGQF